jgi:hypothetical protein
VIDHNRENATREAMEGLGMEYEPPLTEDELNAARGIFWTCIVGYGCWAVIIIWIWG